MELTALYAEAKSEQRSRRLGHGGPLTGLHPRSAVEVADRLGSPSMSP
jgi:hypothetical protein